MFRHGSYPPNVRGYSQNLIYFVYLIMTVKEIRNKIQDLINDIPEESLEELYTYIQSLKDVPASKIKQTKHLAKIIEEDRELLKKLAL